MKEVAAKRWYAHPQSARHRSAGDKINRALVPAQGTAKERDTRELEHVGHGRAGEKKGAAAAPHAPTSPLHPCRNTQC